MSPSGSSPRAESVPPPGKKRRDALEAQAAWLEQQQPAYLVAALGRPGPAGWRELALEIERYRRASGITTRACALGAQPEDTNGVNEWSRVAGRIARYQGVKEVSFDDLCVFSAEPARVQEQAALPLLEDRRWLGALSTTDIHKIIRMPTLVLRRHVSFAAGLLTDRPEDRSARLAGVEAELVDVRANQRPHRAAVREASTRLQALRARPELKYGAAALRLEAMIGVHEAAVARLALVQRRLERQQLEARQGTRQRSRWDGLHQLPLAIGLHSAYELARRDLEALLAIERDPPAYLARELGAVPQGTQGRAAWREGVRLIERYRAEYNVDYPTAALGPPPSDQIAGRAHQETVRAVQALKVEIHRSAVVRHPPGELPEIDLGPTSP